LRNLQIQRLFSALMLWKHTVRTSFTASERDNTLSTAESSVQISCKQLDWIGWFSIAQTSNALFSEFSV